jgi:asparagine synthase (glutamine-hydrolysing)
MCGILGILNRDSAVDRLLVERMTNEMAHRGPDGVGVWSHRNVGLGHRRLAVIDLTEAASQPMKDPASGAIIVYNGELYNFRELRTELVQLGHTFSSKSDTEVVLKAFVQWGKACLDRFNGHFAFGLWDPRDNTLFIARDRYGTRPLYYLKTADTLIFASEIKAILKHPDVRVSVCPEALDEYFTFQNVFSDRTLFEGIRLLPAGCFAVATPDGRFDEIRYWDYEISESPDPITDEEAEEELYRLFTQAVTRQLVADVPIGCYLSGGMDSGSITSIARRNLGRLTTFTGGFDLSSASGLELGFDERSQAESLSNLLKTEHYEMVLHAGDMEHVMPELVYHLEDLRVGQCYPNYYVARLASKFVKVAMSGIGGDELFAGYPWRYYREIAAPSSDQYVQSYYAFWQRLVPDEEKALLFRGPTRAALSGHSTFNTFRQVFPAQFNATTPEEMVNASLYFELKTFLHGLLLVEDKVSMAHGLENRAPFLDNDLVDFAMRLPVSQKLDRLDKIIEIVDENDVGRRRRRSVQSDEGKRVLRRTMGRIIPPEIVGRKKQGFSGPDASWFRGESIDYVSKLLRNPSARSYEYLDPAYVGRVLDEHSSGAVNHRLFIWSVICFEWWLRTFATR